MLHDLLAAEICFFVLFYPFKVFLHGFCVLASLYHAPHFVDGTQMPDRAGEASGRFVVLNQVGVLAVLSDAVFYVPVSVSGEGVGLRTAIRIGLWIDRK